jgi:hypothetical protein
MHPKDPRLDPKFLALKHQVQQFLIKNPQMHLADFQFLKPLPASKPRKAPSMWRAHPDDPCAVILVGEIHLKPFQWRQARRLASECLSVSNPTKANDKYWPNVLDRWQHEDGDGDRGFRGFNPEHAEIILEALNTGVSPQNRPGMTERIRNLTMPFLTAPPKPLRKKDLV